MQFLEAERAISLLERGKVFNEKSRKNVKKIERYQYIRYEKKEVYNIDNDIQR